MRFHIHSLKARAAEQGKRLTWDDIAEGTGIRKPMLFQIANGKARAIRPQYIDALCSFFRVGVEELMSADTVDLPIDLNLRPDRRGKRVGEV